VTEYKGFKFWLVETKTNGQKIWRIQFPGGHKTPPLFLKSEADVKIEIDKIILTAQDIH
jgi:hypothetical protein